MNSIKSKGILLLLIFIFTSCENHIKYEVAIENCVTEEKYKKWHSIGYTITSNCLIGASLPKFRLKALEGDSINEDSLRGKYSVINFWFIECPPCIKEIPELNKLVSDFNDVNFIAIGNDNASDLNVFLEKNEFNFKHIPSGRETYREVFSSMWGYPFTILVNNEGVILDAIAGNLSSKTKTPASLYHRLSLQLQSRI